MNLNCPKCSSADTQKLTLVMDQGGTMEKGAQLGVSYGANIALPIATVFFAILFGILFAISSPLFGLIVFAGILYGGFLLRKKLKSSTKSRYADLSPDMKQSGFQCKRCDSLFIPS